MLAIFGSPTKTPICPSWALASRRRVLPGWRWSQSSSACRPKARTSRPRRQDRASHKRRVGQTMMVKMAAAAGAKHWEPRRLDQLSGAALVRRCRGRCSSSHTASAARASRIAATRASMASTAASYGTGSRLVSHSTSAEAEVCGSSERTAGLTKDDLETC